MNESANSFRWLSDRLGLNATGPKPSPCRGAWNRIKTKMRAETTRIMTTQDWPSDFWICKGTEHMPNADVPTWAPPEDMDEWPTLTESRAADSFVGLGRQTNHHEFMRVLATATVGSEDDWATAISDFYRLLAAPSDQVAQIQVEHVRAWLSVAIGQLLAPLVVTPEVSPEQLVSQTRARMHLPHQLAQSDAAPAAVRYAMPFAEGAIALLYNCRLTELGTVYATGMRIGQSDEWMKKWQWLSTPAADAELIRSVQLAARLLRCTPVLATVAQDLESDDFWLQCVAVAVLRRLLLTLKSMAWLEDALARPRTHVRVQDLVCVAYSAVKPDWPRRLIALSHRSSDAKPALMRTKAWLSSIFGIDANYAPSWETNTGMIWGLFASTPVLVRIDSPNYNISEWCQREAELLQYLETTCDFHASRVVVRMPVSKAPTLGRVAARWMPDSGETPDRPGFPPLCNIYKAGPEEEWTLALLRAAAAMRILTAIYGAAGANNLAGGLCAHDTDPPAIVPTNNVDGWTSYRHLFRELQGACGLKGDAPPLQFPNDVQPGRLDAVKRFLDRIPDLSKSTSLLADVFVALEWQQTVLPWLGEGNYGDTTLIDLRGLTRDTWGTDPRFSLARGIAALRQPPHPVWFIQNADQRVDEWLAYDRPIFTQYTNRQFLWMFEGTLPPDWPDEFARRCGMIIAPPLLAMCRASGNR